MYEIRRNTDTFIFQLKQLSLDRNWSFPRGTSLEKPTVRDRWINYTTTTDHGGQAWPDLEEDLPLLAILVEDVQPGPALERTQPAEVREGGEVQVLGLGHREAPDEQVQHAQLSIDIMVLAAVSATHNTHVRRASFASGVRVCLRGGRVALARLGGHCRRGGGGRRGAQGVTGARMSAQYRRRPPPADAPQRTPYPPFPLLVADRHAGVHFSTPPDLTFSFLHFNCNFL